MQPIADRAALWGLETEYLDAAGQRQVVPDRAIEAILHTLNRAGLAPKGGILPSAITIRQGRTSRLDLTCFPPDAVVRWEISDARSVIANGTAQVCDCCLPNNLPLGTFKIQFARASAGSEDRCTTVLLVAPERVYQGSEPNRRLWALAVQLYGVRSHRNWGHGDFTDLSGLIDLAADIGASGIGINPLHALFDDRPEQASPYAPNSRLFINPLYIDLDAVPEFPGTEATGLGKRIDRLRRCEHVDYTGVAEVKIAGLRHAHEAFHASRDSKRIADFEHFKRERGEFLTRFASFEVLRRRHPQPWWEWPKPWRSPSRTSLTKLRRTETNAVEFYEFVQWIADRQLAACQQKARMRGLPIGLYLDVAVGVDAAGSDAWSEQASILRHLSLGAPPDPFNPDGQNWGIVGFNPRGLADNDFNPFRRTIAAAMRYAGAVRIDHVLGLNRLFLIPHNVSAKNGAYLRFPLETLLAVVAQESADHHCIVIGEDLGTVPDALRTALADWGIWSYRVAMFERHADGSFISPEHYPCGALVTFNTHDLPTYQGWATDHDLNVRRDIDRPSGETKEERANARAGLQAAVAKAGCNRNGGFGDVARYLAATPSRLVLVAIEDVLGITDQPNLPGTVDEYPNWRQRLPIALEDLPAHVQLQSIARIFEEAGRSN